jgi:hypothetical protein
MNLQVNLLKKTERRYQGIVSMKIMVLASFSVLIGVTVLVLSLAGISKMTLKTNLDRARREWTRIDPLAAAIRADDEAEKANRKMLNALEDWSQGGNIPMYSLLRAVQREIPLRVELSQLFAGREPSLESGDVYYVLRLSGRAQGELTAVTAKRQLETDPDVRRFCGEIKLVSSQRDIADTWTFALEGRRLAEEGTSQ